MKKLGGHCGAKEESGGQHKCPAWWFSVVMKIDLT